MSDTHQKVYEEATIGQIKALVTECGGSPESFEGELITQMIQTCLRLVTDDHSTAQLKLMNRALREMRYAYHIFNQYPGGKRLSIFGSSRTPEDHPDYIQAKEFSAAMAEKNWMCITGAANGIMKAGHEGTSKESSFGLSIRLAFESTANSVIEGDPKLISFRYFFTRKLMFMSHSDAVAVFPGGVGTMDELYEILTLMQTGKCNLIPVVLMEGNGGKYWKDWDEYFKKNLLANGWVSPEDENLFYISPTIEKAVEHIENFYKRYHSSRYVKDYLVIRMKSPLNPKQLDILNHQFSRLLKEGKFVQGGPMPDENEFMDLSRLIFIHNRKDFGLLRALIDKINAF